MSNDEFRIITYEQLDMMEYFPEIPTGATGATGEHGITGPTGFPGPSGVKKVLSLTYNSDIPVTDLDFLRPLGLSTIEDRCEFLMGRVGQFTRINLYHAGAPAGTFNYRLRINRIPTTLSVTSGGFGYSFATGTVPFVNGDRVSVQVLGVGAGVLAFITLDYEVV